jgi:polyhydroxyalkanoate synthase
MPKDENALDQVTRESGVKWPVGLDLQFHAAMARMSGGLSPVALGEACADCLQHLWLSPDKQAELSQGCLERWNCFLFYCERACTDQDCPVCIEPSPRDKRFAAPDWRRFPVNLFSQAFLLMKQWWQQATTGVLGASKHHAEVASLMARQLLDTVSSSNSSG